MADNQVLKLIVDELVRARQIKNESDFCRKLGIATGNLAKIKSGERRIPASLKLGLIKKFNINSDFLEKGEYPIVLAIKREDKITQDEVKEPQVHYSNNSLSLIEKMVDGLLHTNEVLTRLVEKGLDADAIQFDTKKAGVSRSDLRG